MQPRRRFGIALTALAVAVACDRSPTGLPLPPVPYLPFTGPRSTVQQVELVPCSDLPYDSVTQVIGPSGGHISIGPHTLRIPKGALGKSTVSITAVLPTGAGANIVRFEPEGLRFKTSVSLRMSYANCQPSPRSKQVVYTDDGGKVLEKPPSLDDPPSQVITGELSHFSNYAVAW